MLRLCHLPFEGEEFKDERNAVQRRELLLMFINYKTEDPFGLGQPAHDNNREPAISKELGD